MKKIVFIEPPSLTASLYPFTLTRKVADIRVGTLTIREKWEAFTGFSSCDAQPDERPGNPVQPHELFDALVIPANLIPGKSLAREVRALEPGQAIEVSGQFIVSCVASGSLSEHHTLPTAQTRLTASDFRSIKYPWDVTLASAWCIREDFDILTQRQTSKSCPAGAVFIAPENIFVDETADISHAVINASEGPVFVGKNARIMEGVTIRGPVSIGAGAVVKMGARLYGAVSIGPGCTVGGEIKNSTLFGNSNKAHDGYLGDSVIGEWCNLGAGTSNSNVKNTAAKIHIETSGGTIDAGLKCGVMMGDFSRTAINTSINTGTIIGVSANVFGRGLTPKNIPSFTWGFDPSEQYRLDKAIEHIGNWKALKNAELTIAEKSLLQHIFDHS